MPNRTGRVPIFKGDAGGVKQPLEAGHSVSYNRFERWSPHKRRKAANDSYGG
jgi:hypothetical protein